MKYLRETLLYPLYGELNLFWYRYLNITRAHWQHASSPARSVRIRKRVRRNASHGKSAIRPGYLWCHGIHRILRLILQLKEINPHNPKALKLRPNEMEFIHRHFSHPDSCRCKTVTTTYGRKCAQLETCRNSARCNSSLPFTLAYRRSDASTIPYMGGPRAAIPTIRTANEDSQIGFWSRRHQFHSLLVNTQYGVKLKN
jgi:hypothetical protein